jgi:hypothetical protein
MKYFAIIKGGDYTINCGLDIVEIPDATNINDV